ncbi:MAG: glutathione peroxidase [Spirochaetales bacterium]|nr:glutathione peroxidase [Leptospiraceae bacterium]MCP5481412.1 glutathione peroxidase [Spirochaetales bacterium]MCP5486044.1 glutathione peroxidase [Spirochaetales bacterium]
MSAESIYDIEVTTVDGRNIKMEEYRDKVLLVVNTASQCGFTPQYDGLEKLYEKHSGKGLVVLGFPCNQFGKQEPGDESEIQEFCKVNYGVTFPIFKKVDVNGNEAHPLFRHLKKEQPGALGTEAIKWNFTKFLVDRDGRVKQRFAPNTEPAELEKDLEQLL